MMRKKIITKTTRNNERLTAIRATEWLFGYKFLLCPGMTGIAAYI